MLLIAGAVPSWSQNHPSLILTREGIKNIRNAKEFPALFQTVLEDTQLEVDAEIAMGIEVPVPKDLAGGYTHERHKRNFLILQKAGNLFQITNDEKYAIYIRDMLMAYAKLYPTLEVHPISKSYAKGKIFWQCLNDANWLVYASQAFDCIYDWLKEEERDFLKKQLFRPFADFLSKGNPQFFNRIHNHSTWGNAAVGMIGLVMDDEELINRALYGLPDAELSESAKDNDGGFIKLPGQTTAGFFAQLDHAFSPDGYYTEGPYYQRYAMSPFILFAKALENKRPDLKIFEYRDGLLKKAVFALLYQTDADGQFFPLNDAQKGMSFKSRELISAVDIIYDYCGKDPQLLSIAAAQEKVELDASGFAVAQGIQAGKAKAFDKKSIELRDGKNGDEGAVGILRMPGKEDELCLVYKYTAHGLSHGHFDKLSYSLYDNSGEIIQDYGMARWVNINQKQGGGYLPENTSWAKQTIAHNTLVVDQKSHFGDDFETGNAHHSDSYFFDAKNLDFQIVSAKENNASPGVAMHRTMALLNDEAFQNPIVIDIFRVEADQPKQFDLPFWYQGHLLETDFEYKTNVTNQSILGDQFGYQHLREEAKGKSRGSNATLNWMGNGKFYTALMLTNPDDEIILARLGANDPNFNLRHDPCLILRKKEKEEAIFVSIIESHGIYSPVEELPIRPFSTVKEVTLLYNDQKYSAIKLTTKSDQSWTLVISNENNETQTKHKLIIGKDIFEWEGPYHLKKNK